MKKRLLSAILSIVMLLTLFPVSAFAATTVASGYCGGEGDGTNLSWTLGSSSCAPACERAEITANQGVQ